MVRPITETRPAATAEPHDNRDQAARRRPRFQERSECLKMGSQRAKAARRPGGAARSGQEGQRSQRHKSIANRRRPPSWASFVRPAERRPCGSTTVERTRRKITARALSVTTSQPSGGARSYSSKSNRARLNGSACSGARAPAGMRAFNSCRQERAELPTGAASGAEQSRPRRRSATRQHHRHRPDSPSSASRIQARTHCCYPGSKGYPVSYRNTDHRRLLACDQRGRRTAKPDGFRQPLTPKRAEREP